MNIKESNNLIVQFMGGKKDNLTSNWFYFIKDGAYIKETDLKYHISWDWLMPVVKKIKQTGEKKLIYSIEFNLASKEMEFSRLYEATVGFIKFYNRVNK